MYLYLEKFQQLLVALPVKFRRAVKSTAVEPKLGVENPGSHSAP
jgi:hypothetical protein